MIKTETSQLSKIEIFLTDKLAWVKRAKKKEEKAETPSEISLQKFLTRELNKAVDSDEEAYAEALNARTPEEKHSALVQIIASRSEAAMAPTSEEAEECSIDSESAEKTPRKKGYLERHFDELATIYLTEPTDSLRDELLHIVSQFEVNRRVRFFYDLQKLRIGANNRREIYAQNYGIKDLFIDYAGDQLEELEKRTEKMVDRILDRSPDRKFYAYLRDTYLGVGTMMAGCLIAELGAPERFRTVSALWKYCGLAVVDNDPETGHGGHAQRKAKGELATWNHFLRTKLLGVLSGCMIKAQTRYIGTPEETTKAQNVLVLNGYKSRENTKQSIIPLNLRVYDKKGKEIFQYKSSKPIEVFTADNRPKGTAIPCKLPRRSKAHIQKMAVRYMIKMFLAETLNVWRNYKGFESLPTYDEAKLRGGIPHGGFNNRKLPTPNETAVVQ